MLERHEYAMSTTSESFQHELRQARAFNCGEILHATASFACLNPRCAVTVERIGFVEEPGGPCLQWTLVCSRCRQPFGRYIGLEVGR